MLAQWLQHIIIANLYFEMSTIDSGCFLKSNDGDSNMKSEVVGPNGRTALSWDWRYPF